MTVNASGPPPPRPRARTLGLEFGADPTGPANAITDVPGVGVGHVTLWADPDVRTGVTALVVGTPADMFERPPAAATAVLNGAGELTGSLQLAEWGLLETPVVLCATMSVGRAYDAVVDTMIDAVPTIGTDGVIIPIVGECDDSWLDAAHRRSVTTAHVRLAIDEATGSVGRPVAEGAVGAGAGMMCFGHKAGIGTASRLVEVDSGTGTVGVLVLANFGQSSQLRLPPSHVAAPVHGDDLRPPAGSCIGVVATDVPLDRHQLRRVAARVGLGLARLGSNAQHGSGEIFCAFSTGMRLERYAGGYWSAEPISDEQLDIVFGAVVDATEEAVLNSLLVADTVLGRDGHLAPGLRLAPGPHRDGGSPA